MMNMFAGSAVEQQVALSGTPPEPVSVHLLLMFKKVSLFLSSQLRKACQRVDWL